jgi:hypothetical protein
VKLAMGTGNAGGVPSGPVARSSTGGGAMRVTIGRSDGLSSFGLGREIGRALVIGFDAASRGAADVVAGFAARSAEDLAFPLSLAFVLGLARVFGWAIVLAWTLILAALGAGRAPPDARFFCAGLEDFVALAMGVPR